MKKHPWLVLTVIVITIVGALGFIKYRQISAAIAQAESYPPPSATITEALVREGTYQASVKVPGEIIAANSIDITTELSGRISALNLTPGQQYPAGTVLLQLDASLELAQKREAQARLALAQLELARLKKLQASKYTDQQALDTQQANLDIATAQIQQLEAVIDKKRVVAPFAGSAGLHQLNIGDYVAAGTNLTSFTAINEEQWADFRLAPEHAAQFAQQQVTLHINEKSEPVSATVTAIDPAVNSSNRLLRYRAAFSLADNLPIGSAVIVELALGAAQTLPIIPRKALRFDRYGAKVFVIETAPDGSHLPHVARLQRVQWLDINDREVAITEGLQAGQRIADDGAFKLTDGLLINVVERNTP